MTTIPGVPSLQKVVVEPSVHQILSEETPVNPKETLLALSILNSAPILLQDKGRLATYLTHVINKPYQDEEVVDRAYAIAQKVFGGLSEQVGCQVGYLSMGKVGLFSDNPLEQAVFYNKEPVLRYHLKHKPQTLEKIREPLKLYAQQHSSQCFASVLYVLHQKSPEVLREFLLEETTRLQRFLGQGASETYCNSFFSLLQFYKAYKELAGLVFLNHDQTGLLMASKASIVQTLSLLHEAPMPLIESLTNEMRSFSRKIEVAADEGGLQKLRKEVVVFSERLTEMKSFLVDFTALAPHETTSQTLLEKIQKLLGFGNVQSVREGLERGLVRLLEIQTADYQTDLSCCDALINKIDQKIHSLEESPAAGVKRKKY